MLPNFKLAIICPDGTVHVISDVEIATEGLGSETPRDELLDAVVSDWHAEIHSTARKVILANL